MIVNCFLCRPDGKQSTTPQQATPSAPSAPPMGGTSMYPTIASPEVSWPGLSFTLISRPSTLLEEPAQLRPQRICCMAFQAACSHQCLPAGWFATLSSAPRPPAMAASTAGDGSAATPAQQPAAPSAPVAAEPPPTKQNGKQPEAAAQHTDFDDDDGMCVVCMEHPCEAGFLHGER